MNNNTNTEIVEPQTQPQPAFPCTKCERAFVSMTALRMHQMRMHTRAGKRGHKIGNKRAVKAKRASVAMKASWRRRKAAPVTAVHFCPRCGCNIHAVQTAIRFASETTS